MDTSTTIAIDDRELLERLRRCVADDRRTTGRLLVHMGEVDARGLYRDEGFSSMFDYCVRELHMSESETALRIRAARFGRRYPAAIQMLVRGELHLSAIGLLSSVMSPEHITLLQEAAFKSKREVEAIIAKHFPQPDVPSVIRKLPGTKLAAAELQPSLIATDAIRTAADVKTASTLQPTGESGSTLQGPSPEETDVTTAGARLVDCVVGGMVRPQGEISAPAATDTQGPARAKQQPAPAPQPLSEGRYKVQFTADQRLHDKLAQAQHLMRHQVADGDLARVVERALDLLIADRRKKLFGQVARPRAERSTTRNRTVHSTGSASEAQPNPFETSAHAVETSASFCSTTTSAGTPEPTRRATPTQIAVQVLTNATGAAAPKASQPESTAGAAPPSVGRKSAAGRNPRMRSRHIPSSVKRRVVARDGERCSFIAPDGRRCQERGWLQLHHNQPYAHNGPATTDNIRVLCRSHNMLMADRDFGRAFMVNAVTTKQRPDATLRSGRPRELPREPGWSEARPASEPRKPTR
jgi:hypothetical protein